MLIRQPAGSVALPTSSHSFNAAGDSRTTMVDIDQHKASRTKTVTLGKGKGLLTRRSTRKPQTRPVELSSSDSTLNNAGPGLSNGHDAEKDKHPSPQDAQPQPRPSLLPASSSASIIPDPIPELPAWYKTDLELAAASAAKFRAKYPLHNRFGPRRYYNHLLAPPKHENRPPSIFSPSFPPMASAPEHAQDPLRLPGPSRTPSGSPLPTPSSSQTRLHDPTKPRTRKVSTQTAHDNVDMLDITDPWGANWHHESPYDVGLNTERTATTPDPESSSSRPRRRSLTHSRHKTVTPSPLSQSTSAVHLHAPEIDITRRLSKRRKPFTGLFSGHHATDGLASAPLQASGGSGLLQRKISRRQSHTVLPSTASIRSAQSGLKDKRGSMLGRLAKRFSVLRKPDAAKASRGQQEELPVSDRRMEGRDSPSSHRSPESERQGSVSPVKNPGSGRRIPPPSIDEATTPVTPYDPSSVSVGGERSSTSLSSDHASLAMGKLTITNPDDPIHSTVTSPTARVSPLPDASSTPAMASHPDLHIGNEPSHNTPPQTLPPVEHPSASQHSPSDLVPQQAAAFLPPSSPPLPELPPPTPAPLENSLPTTPTDSRPPSPSTEQRSSYPAPSQLRNLLSRTETSLASVEDSPLLSRASMIVNPPTPYAPPASILPNGLNTTSASPTPENHMPQEGTAMTSKADVPHIKTTNLTKSRQTETFKLVRSPSGTMYSEGDIIPGMGEKWEVIESPSETPKRSKKDRASSKDVETTPTKQGSRKAERREPSSSAEDDDEQNRRKRSAQKRSSMDYARSTRTPSVDTVRRSNGIDRGTSSQRTQRASTRHNSAVIANGQISSEQASFMSVRPTSEFESAADINALKAKEAWEMERLWKARSMADGTQTIAIPTIRSDSRPSTIMSMDLHRPGTIPSVTDLQRATTLPALHHGSSHTYFMIQTPYNGHHSGSDPTSPASSTPIIYTPQQPTNASSTHQYQKSYRSFPESIPFPTTSPPVDPLAANPLPEPPRLSTYRPAPLPSTFSGPGSGTSTPEYWAQYAGVATSP